MCTCTLAEPRGERGVAEHAGERGGERLGVARRHEQAGAVVGDEVGQAADA